MPIAIANAFDSGLLPLHRTCSCICICHHALTVVSLVHLREILAGTRAIQRGRTRRPGVTTVADTHVVELGPSADEDNSIGGSLKGTFTQQQGLVEINVQMYVCSHAD
jgi:hypothetical protein